MTPASKTSQELAAALLTALEAHAADALAIGLPEEIYVAQVQDHARATFRRLQAETDEE